MEKFKTWAKENKAAAGVIIGLILAFIYFIWTRVRGGSSTGYELGTMSGPPAAPSAGGGGGSDNTVLTNAFEQLADRFSDFAETNQQNMQDFMQAQAAGYGALSSVIEANQENYNKTLDAFMYQQQQSMVNLQNMFSDAMRGVASSISALQSQAAQPPAVYYPPPVYTDMAYGGTTTSSNTVKSGGTAKTPVQTGLDNKKVGNDGLTDYTRQVKEDLKKGGAVSVTDAGGWAAWEAQMAADLKAAGLYNYG